MPGGYVAAGDRRYLEISEHYGSGTKQFPRHYGHDFVAGADEHCGVDGEGEMLPIIFFSVLFGLGLSSLPATHREPLVTVFRSISETMFKVTHMVMRYAPVGVFALIAVTVANFGFSSLWPLAKLVLLVHFAILFFALVVLGIVARLCGLASGS
ncbi:cation:dicarboxylate symporter family transporter [Escherichia coli]